MPAFVNPKNEQEFQDVATYGSLMPIDTGGYQPGDPVPEAARYYQMALQVRDEFRQQIQHVKDSADYSTDGKQRRLAEVGTAYLPRLDMFWKFLEQLQLKLKTLRVKMTIQPPVGDSGAQMTRACWIVDNLGEDALEVKGIYMAALDAGEQDVFDAIRKIPKFMQQLSDEDIAEGVEAWNERTSPEQSKLARDLKKAIDSLQAVVEGVASIITSIMSSGDTDAETASRRDASFLTCGLPGPPRQPFLN